MAAVRKTTTRKSTAKKKSPAAAPAKAKKAAAAKKPAPAKKPVAAKKPAAKAKAPAKVAKKTAPAAVAASKAVAPKAAAPAAELTGAPAPGFRLRDATGNTRTLADYAGRWLVLYFYPRDDTPGCTIEACEFTTLWDELAALDAHVVGVSPDSPERHTKFIDKYKLRVELLSDPAKETLAAYGAYGLKKMYGKDVEGVLRSTVIIDPAGKVAHHFRNVKAAGHAAAVRDTLRGLRAQ